MLVKPNGRLELEAAQEQALDIQILEQLSDIKDGQNYFTVALFGGIYKEIVHPGRLPLFEKEIELLKKENALVSSRVESLEDDRNEWKTMIRTASRIAAFQGSIIGAVITMAIEFFRHR